MLVKYTLIRLLHTQESVSVKLNDQITAKSSDIFAEVLSSNVNIFSVSPNVNVKRFMIFLVFMSLKSVIPQQMKFIPILQQLQC